MQKRISFLLVFIFISLMSLAACSQTAATAPSGEAGVVAASATPDIAAYQAKMDAAQAAFSAADFEQAMALAKEAAALNPNINTPWELYREASVAAAADDYLRTLPDRRYRIDPEHFLANLANGEQYFIIDVREPDEYAQGHIENAVNIPLSDLIHNLDKLPDSKSAPILLYCHTQKRATHALVTLRELGYSNVYNLEGGIVGYNEWTADNPLPTPGPTATFEPEGPSC
ncbi:MAG TPA: rhodanese-like domain-containing protein [Anaerolineae bacterium]|nr:rhodanese-like domain-containing protein [Anaerolineae bacterium]